MIGEYEDADNVRISGIRLQGADPSVAPEGSPPSTGVSIHSSLNVEIDNNESPGGTSRPSGCTIPGAGSIA